MLVLLRLCCATLSAFIFVLYLPHPAYLVFQFSGPSSDYYENQWWYDDLAFKIKLITAALWMATCVFLELRSLRRVGQPTPKLLTHLRYGPIAVLILSIATILATDLFLIQYSRFQLVRWIHSDAATTEMPRFYLHNNDRGRCGNGRSATRYFLYGDTPAAYIDDPDPATRARALQASMYVYDWVNGPNDGPSITALQKAAADPDPRVRDIAAKFKREVGHGL
jgi:hypothetical protein